MSNGFLQYVESQTLPPEQIAARTREIYHVVLRQSQHINDGNFSRFDTADLRLLFDLYDQRFFDGGVRESLGDRPLTFRLSSRMTRAAGKATRKELRLRGSHAARTEYEITVSTTLLLQAFQDDRPVVMSGIECRDRLSALQRIFEHELIHLIEMLLWVNSSCSAPRFQSLANRFFGHTDHRHQLITPGEQALAKFGIQPGDRVVFRFDGREYAGFVNRITKRATVLVEDRRGTRYTDGKHYAAFYVPIQKLQRMDAKSE